MNYYLTTDTHFGHDAIIRLALRPKNFENKILKGFKAIQKDDILIHLGDVGFCDKRVLRNIFTNIPCKKILCKGNHDRKSNSWYYDIGFDFVCEYFIDKIFGKRILFSHIPHRVDNKWDYNFCGHFHDNKPTRHEAEFLSIYEKERHILLALEKNDYKLFNLKRILENRQYLFEPDY